VKTTAFLNNVVCTCRCEIKWSVKEMFSNKFYSQNRFAFSVSLLTTNYHKL